ncbi:integrase core domain-containing protein [Streptomyces sp. NPDC001450]
MGGRIHLRRHLVRDRLAWHGLADVELGTSEWIDWFNDQRLHTAIGDIPPHEHETNHYVQHQPQPAAGVPARLGCRGACGRPAGCSARAGVLDLPSAQVAAVAARGVRLVTAENEKRRRSWPRSKNWPNRSNCWQR